MTFRPIIIVSGFVAIAVIATVAYFWLADGDQAAVNDQSSSISSEGSAFPTDGDTSDTDSTDASETDTGESLETIMLEIERDASGDDRALEDELAGESESFMEGAVVMEQLGQSYDETSY
jgi:hypothetical protein